MNQINLPTIFNVINLVSKELPNIKPLFKTDNKEFQDFQNILENNQDLFNLSANPFYIKYIYLVMLLNFAGSKSKFLKQISQKEQQIKLTINNNIIVNFDLEKLNDQGKKFMQYYAGSILKMLYKKNINKDFIEKIYYDLLEHQENLEEIKSRLEYLLQNPDEINKLVKDSPHFFFLILNFLPNEQLNTFFINLSQHIDQDLEIQSENKNIKIKALFEHSTPDIRYLNQKVDLYFQTFFITNNASIITVTIENGTKILVDFLDNQTVRTKIFESAEQLLKQIMTRYFLFVIFTKHLKILLKL